MVIRACRRRNYLLIFLAGLSFPLSSFAGKKDEAAELLSRILGASNIRAEGAQAFSLKATFRLHDKKSEQVGTYLETWLSNTKWRREIVMGNLRRFEMADGRKKWLVADPASPDVLVAVENALAISFLDPEGKVSKLSDRTVDGASTRCIHTKEAFSGELYCLNVQKSVLVTKESSLGASKRSISYSDYQEFGRKVFPRDIRVTNAELPTIDITVTALSVEGLPEASPFTVPQGALELGNCSPHAHMSPPQVLSRVEPEYPNENWTGTQVAVVSLVIDSTGGARIVGITKSGGKDLDAGAVRAIQQWKFRPATCQGEPMAAMVNIEVQRTHF